MAHINSRSPYFVNTSDADLQSATLALYIYTGQQTVARPASPTYTLTATAINNEVTFEIGDLIKDKIQFIYDGTYRSDAVWVDYQVTQQLSSSTNVETMVQKFAVDGYNYFSEGANYTTDRMPLLSVDYIRVLKGEDFKFPVNRNFDNGVDSTFNCILVRAGAANVDNTLTSSDLSGQVIRHINMPYNDKNSVVRIQGDVSGVIKEVPIIYEEECKFDPYKLTFINRWGAMEDMWFFKRSDKSLTVENQTYQNNQILSGGTYNVREAQMKRYNVTSKESMSLNTGFLREEFNESFTQLMQSEKVWITLDNDFVPVNIKDTDLSFKTSLNDKLINYGVEIEFAFNKMNTVR